VRPDLSPSQRQYLKGLAHALQPVVQIGAAGVASGVIDATHEALDRHELIKIKFPRGDKAERVEAATALAERTHAALCQVIGRVAILYRRREKNLPGKPRIELP
jgi:RNA-binding protein